MKNNLYLFYLFLGDHTGMFGDVDVVTTEVAVDILMRVFSSPEQLVEVDTGVIPTLVEHVDQVFGRGVAGRAWCEGATAESRNRGLHTVRTALQGGHAVDDAHVAGIMNVNIEFIPGEGLLHSTENLLDQGWIGDADRIAEGEVVNADVAHFADELEQGTSGLHLSLEGTAENGGDVLGDLHLRKGVTDLFEFIQGLLAGALDVVHVVGLAQGHDGRDLSEACVPGCLGAVEIGNQGKELHAAVAVFLQNMIGDLPGVAHLRDGLGADEGGDLHLLIAGVDDAVDDVQLDFRGDEFLDTLESVAGADFYYFDFLIHFISSCL